MVINGPSLNQFKVLLLASLVIVIDSRYLKRTIKLLSALNEEFSDVRSCFSFASRWFLLAGFCSLSRALLYYAFVPPTRVACDQSFVRC